MVTVNRHRESMTKTIMTLSRRARKTRFLRALKRAGLNVEQWADLHGKSRGHCYEVLKGSRVSAPLTAAMDAFIAEYDTTTERAA